MTEVTREEFGQQYVLETSTFGSSTVERWRNSGEGNKVYLSEMSRPPGWRLVVPHAEDILDFRGDNAEARAFSAADLYIRQSLGPPTYLTS